MANQVHIMIDNETLGDTPDSVIVSIAAQKFTLEDGPVGDPFSVNVDPISCKKLGFKINQDTIDWWMRQPKEARDAWKKDPWQILDALVGLNHWIAKDHNAIWWARGINFDISMLQLYYRALGMSEPYKYWNVRDQRTVTELFGVNTKKKRVGTYHVALDDVLTQIKDLRIALTEGYIEEDIPF